MAFKDILLHLDSYPDATSPEAIDQAVGLCAALGGPVSATALHVCIPLQSNALAEFVLGLREMAVAEEARSLATAREQLDRFQRTASKAGVFGTVQIVRAATYEAADHAAVLGRTRDLTVIPYADEGADPRLVAEAAIFSSGRPVVIFHAGPGRKVPTRVDTVAIAWDGGCAAARAVADALPVLCAAKTVRIITVLKEKPGVEAGVATDLLRHLALHGVSAVVDEVEAGGEAIGVVINRYLTGRGVDLLVMGAFGHSRVREFVLGGATRGVLHDPAAPVLLSH